MGPFYGVVLQQKLDILGSLRSIEAWRADDTDGRPITFVRSRPDIIAHHLGGSTYYSNVPMFERDLQEIATRPAAPHELALRELRYVEHGRLPFGVFEPYPAWPLHNICGFIQTDVALAATIVLELFHAYTAEDAATAVTPSGELIRVGPPHFANIWRSEMPSFTGSEPELWVPARIREARSRLARLTQKVTGRTDDEVLGRGRDPYWERGDETDAAAFEAELTALRERASAGPALARLLREVYRLPLPGT